MTPKEIGWGYSYVVVWSQSSEEWVGRCLEFPSLSFLDDSPKHALTGIMNLVDTVVADMQKAGEEIPRPTGKAP